MKKIINNILLALTIGLSVTLVSCNGYLDEIPKGQKIPETLADFEALLRDEYGCHRVDITQANLLLNDRYPSASYLNYYPLWKANYMWDETADRTKLNNSDETTYYASYASISSCNLIIEHAPSSTNATENEKNVVIAQARVLRAMNYFTLVNYYAETYNAATAATKLAVPVISSADINALSKQVSIKELYDYILKEISESIPNLPQKSATILHPSLGTAYAFYARVYLQMSDYTNALKYAEEALNINNKLYDWVAYYESNKTQILNPISYTATSSPYNYTYVENYNYRHGSSNYASTESNIPVDRAARFEDGDARFAARWKIRTVGTDTYYAGTTNGYFNYGGLTTTEMYLIKAECLARNNNITGAMDALNAVRKTRILPAKYQDLTATSIIDAIKKIWRTKENELIFSIVPFADARRLNLDSNYARTFTKIVNGTTYTLSPTSHLWTMVFPMGATSNPGNGTLTQNVDK